MVYYLDSDSYNNPHVMDLNSIISVLTIRTRLGLVYAKYQLYILNNDVP